MYDTTKKHDWDFKYTPTNLYQDLEIPLYRNYEYLQETRYVRDENGVIVYENNEPKTTQVTVKSFTDAFNYLKKHDISISHFY